MTASPMSGRGNNRVTDPKKTEWNYTTVSDSPAIYFHKTIEAPEVRAVHDKSEDIRHIEQP